MNLQLAGFLIDGVGKVLVSYTAIMVHYRVWKEHKMDERVFHEMRKEQIIGMIGLVCIIIGMALEIPGYVQ